MMLRSLVLLALALPLLALTADAQQRTLSASAAEVAARLDGTVRASSGGRVVARALYLALRDRHASEADAVALARRAGLDPLASSPLGFFRDDATKESSAALMALPSERRARVERLAAELARVVELHYRADVHPEEAARRMMAIASVEYAEAVPASGIDGASARPNDPLITDQQHLERIKAYEAWDVWPGDSNTVIGIVDAGIDNTHEDLWPNIQENPGEEGLDALGGDKRTNLVDDDQNGLIDDWRGANMNYPGDGSVAGDTRANTRHGTAVAGAAAAATNNGIGIAGVANLCQFFPVKTMPAPGGPLSKSYAGIEYCARRGFDVVNCSFGDPTYSRSQQNFITYLVELYDIAIVASAGNDVLYEVRYPAGYRGVMAVGALDGVDGFATTWGEHVDVSAPVGMMTVDTNQYAPGLVATSFSAPVASGVVALTRSRWPQLTSQQALAHVRLTSDPISSAGERQGLIGFGRVNALSAVSVEPFSRPGIVVDTIWLTDEAGATRETFSVGERGRIHLRVRNLLGDAENVRIRLVDYADPDAAVTIDSSWHDLGAVATNGLAPVSTGYPFELVGADTNRLRLRVEIAADGGYEDYDFAATFVFVDRPSIAIYATGQLALAVSSRGNIGYADYPENTYGLGVTYDDKYFLFEGGFIAATSPTRIVNNVRGANSSVQDRDFTVVELPSDTNGGTLTLSDAAAGESNEIGLELRLQTIVRNDVPNAFAVDARARNVNATPIDSLLFGMFADWDLTGEGDDQAIDTREIPGAAVPIYAVVSGFGYYVASGTAAPGRAPIHYAIDNAGNLALYQNFNHAKKWHTLSNGIGSRSVGPADVSLVTGRVLTDLERDEEDRVLFVVGIGRSETEAADAMQALALGHLSGVGEEHAVTGMLGEARPNPATIEARVAVDLAAGASLELHDALGRLVLDLSDRIPQGGSGAVAIDASRLEPGVYVLTASDRRGRASTRFVVVK